MTIPRLLAQAHAATTQAQPMVVLSSADSLTTWVKIVSETGFPIAMCIALLFIFERRLTRMMLLMERMADLRAMRPKDEE